MDAGRVQKFLGLFIFAGILIQITMYGYDEPRQKRIGRSRGRQWQWQWRPVGDCSSHMLQGQWQWQQRYASRASEKFLGTAGRKRASIPAGVAVRSWLCGVVHSMRSPFFITPRTDSRLGWVFSTTSAVLYIYRYCKVFRGSPH